MDLITVIFYGLIAFVPHSSEFAYYGLFVDASSPVSTKPNCTDRAVDVHGHPAYPAHTSALLIPMDFIQQDGCGGAETKLMCNPTGSKEMKLFRLSGHDVKLEVGAKSKELLLLGGRPRDASKTPYWVAPTPSEAKDFSWLTQMSDIARPRAVVNPSCMAQNPTAASPPCDIGARFLIDDGSLESFLTSRSPVCKSGVTHWNAPFVTFRFKEPHDPSLAMGHGVSASEGTIWKLPAATGTARTITLKRFDGSSECEIKLSGGSLMLYALNIAKVDQIEDTYYCDITPKIYSHEHFGGFQEFYKLAKDAAQGVCPIPELVCTPSGSPRCPQVELVEK